MQMIDFIGVSVYFLRLFAILSSHIFGRDEDGTLKPALAGWGARHEPSSLRRRHRHLYQPFQRWHCIIIKYKHRDHDCCRNEAEFDLTSLTRRRTSLVLASSTWNMHQRQKAFMR
jgi:hypothetical protein